MTATLELKTPDLNQPSLAGAFKHILAATDLSAASNHALCYAVSIAEQNHASLCLVHAAPKEPRGPVPMDPLPREMDAKLLAAEQGVQELAAELADRDIRVTTLVARGFVGEVLLDEIQRSHADLLVVGTHGRGGISKLALGSVAEEMLRTAPCPVLTVGPHARPLESKYFRRILFATDFGPASTRAIPLVMALAERNAAKLIFLNLISPLPMETSLVAYAPPTYAAEILNDWQSAERIRATRRLHRLIPDDAKLAQVPEYVVSMDFSGGGILEAAELHHADLIVMGANHAVSAKAAAHIPWAIVHKVVCGATCPVLTVAE